jgi:chromosome partitioning protein
MFDSRASLPNEVKADIEKFLNNARGTNCAWSQAQVLPVYIRRNIKLAEAPSYGKTIFEYEPNCHGAEDYEKVAELINGQTHPEAAANTDSAAAGKDQGQMPIEIKEVYSSGLETEPSEVIQTPVNEPDSENQRL